MTTSTTPAEKGAKQNKRRGVRLWAAAVWLAVLTALVAMTLARFRRLDDLAGLLLWPYLLWCCFALYLNAGVALLN